MELSAGRSHILDELQDGILAHAGHAASGTNAVPLY
jgi:hypothetical protein